GFKIDLRFIFDVAKHEYGVGAGEMINDSSQGKLHNDLGKLVREGKDVLDGILDMSPTITATQKATS
ncbi:hypothetical protein BC941DRAFT_363560, partial [Chlamydoabsidia padenii]